MKTVYDAVEAAITEGDKPILEEIDRQVQEYNAQPPYRILAYGKEETRRHVHGFNQWLWLLQDGVAALPDRIPRSVLLAWRDGYESNWKNSGKPWCPMPFWRCMDCAAVLPHGAPPGWPETGCPACCGKRVWHADLSKPLGKNWIDPRPVRRGAAAE